MEQKQTKEAKKQLWSVYVFIERKVQVGRSIVRKKRLTSKQSYKQLSGPVETVLHKFLYLNVTKMYKKNNILYIQVGVGKKKELHRHEVKDISSLQIREHDRSGRVQ